MATKTCMVCGCVKEEDYMILKGTNYFCSSACFNAFYITQSDTSTVSAVASSITNVMLLVANNKRKMVTIYNNSTAVLFIKYGMNASVDSFTLRIGSGDYLEFPFPCYMGRIDGFWETANGNAMVTEIT